MNEINNELNSLLQVQSLKGWEPEDAISLLGHLIDLSLIYNYPAGTKHAIELGIYIETPGLSGTQLSTLHYFLSNAWANLRQANTTNAQERWKWEQSEFENQIMHLRHALNNDALQQLSRLRQCQILTNLGNLMNSVGRFVEAIEYWDKAIYILPSFKMAIGNRGYGLVHYGNSLYDSDHKLIFWRHAHAELNSALATNSQDKYPLEIWASKPLEEKMTWLKSTIRPEFLDSATKMEEFTFGDSTEEVNYRRWACDNRLFLNPLNDLGPHSLSAHDILTTPSMVVKNDEGMHFQGFFNQIKQEYVSARYLYYEGISSKTPHFSDKGVLLFNTLDYPAYSLAIEKVKITFRMFYSLFDKMAFFLNHYLSLGIPNKKINFRSFWYIKQDRKKGLLPIFENRDNWPLRGLFWLSKDLFEDTLEFRECLQPDARELDTIRNTAEHKYLKLHEDLWIGPHSDLSIPSSLIDTLALSIYRDDFSAKTYLLMKMARASLIYLALAIHAEEQKRAQERPQGQIVLPSSLDTWEDNWKL